MSSPIKTTFVVVLPQSIHSHALPLYYLMLERSTVDFLCLLQKLLHSSSLSNRGLSLPLLPSERDTMSYKDLISSFIDVSFEFSEYIAAPIATEYSA